MKEYEKASKGLEQMKLCLDKQKRLNNDENDKLKDLEQKHKTLLIQFNEYKLKYSKDIVEEVKDIKSENKKYSKMVSKLENDLNKLNDKVVVQQQAVLSSSSNKSGLSNFKSTNKRGNLDNEVSQNSLEESSEIVYANGGRSKSNKYHKSPTAHKMEGAISMSKSEAISRGYIACKKCY